MESFGYYKKKTKKKYNLGKYKLGIYVYIGVHIISSVFGAGLLNLFGLISSLSERGRPLLPCIMLLSK